MISATSSPQLPRKVASLTVDIHPLTKPGFASTIPKLANSVPFNPCSPSSATSGQSGVSTSHESQASSSATSFPAFPLTSMIIPPRTSSFTTKYFDGCPEQLEEEQRRLELRPRSHFFTTEEKAVGTTVLSNIASVPAATTDCPRICKMLEKHPAVKVDWKVPEPIKAAGETLRGFLIITAKDLSSELKTAAAEAAAGVVGKGHHGTVKKIKGKDKRRVSPATAESEGMSSSDRAKSRSGKRSKSKRESSMVKVEHIDIELTGVEEVTTGNGLLSRTRCDQHCFLQKTQSLPVGEMRWIYPDSSSPTHSSALVSPTMSSTSSSISSSYTSSSSSGSTSGSTSTSLSTSSSSPSYTSAPSSLLPLQTSSSRKNTIPSMPPFVHNDNKLFEQQQLPTFEPGCILSGTQQGIPFAMRVPEKVGGSFKSAHASVNYQLTAHVHIRLGREVFVLKHPLPVSLFELVQIRATKVASPHDITPPSAASSSSSPSATATFTSPSVLSPTKTGVRFVIPQSNSVLGTASVRPYSLWGLGPATSSQSSQYQYSNSHGYGRYHHQHQRRGSLSSSSTSGARGQHHQRQSMTRSHSATSGAMSALSQGPPTAQQQLSSTMGDALTTDNSTLRPLRQEERVDSLSVPNYSLPCKRSSRRVEDEKCEQLDEVGFGAHIDKSVAAAGDSVTMDMFVCKSDLMKVVNIKVSLVETIQIYSFINDEKDQLHHDLNEKSPAVALSNSKQPQQTKRKRLMDTHVVKVAKAYVPAQAEENHANYNHLKGYYEDYEDFRTTKSLSMYKLSMRIPETALTITDRELVKVEYAFIIKFFFKGRMGAFLELPIEIVSQYNHNRISTISGAISCVSNSVQIALPPVPILVKRTDTTIQPESFTVTATSSPEDLKALKDATSGSPPSPVQTTTVLKEGESDQERELSVPQKSAIELSETADSATVVQEIPSTPTHGVGGDVLRVVTAIEQLLPKDPFALQQTDTPLLSASSNDTILATSKVQGSEFLNRADDDSLKNTKVFLDTADIKASTPSPVAELAANVVVLQRDDEPELPSIVIDSARSTPSLEASLTNKKDLSMVALAIDGTVIQGDTSYTTDDVSTVMASPALPLLFDLTSAAAPVESPQSAHSAHSSNTKDNDSNGLSVPHLYHGPASATTGNGHNGGGLVAKIAKSISSSPLLRSSRSAPTGTSLSPSGSASNLHLLSGSGSGTNGSSSSPQNPQSTTFALAVTALSALTLLSSVSQAAVVGSGNGGDHGGDEKSQPCGNNGSNGQLTNGGGDGSGSGKAAAKLHRKGMDKLSGQQSLQQQQRRLQNGSSRRTVGPLKSCLKKSLPSRIRQRPLQPNGASPQRKKVTFAKGSTPSSSPTGSMIFIEPHQPYLQQQHLRPLVHHSQSIAGPANSAQPIRVVPHPVQVIPSQPVRRHAAVPFAESPVKSPSGSFSPRSLGTHHQLHHPFDSHPSRLSPLEKQTLENQDHQLLLHTHNAKDTTAKIGFASHQEFSEEEENEDDESEEDEDDGDDDDDDEDEDDECESEEQRVERRRVARVAWLAKYGDAFKQVYGAVPELPPI